MLFKHGQNYSRHTPILSRLICSNKFPFGWGYHLYSHPSCSSSRTKALVKRSGVSRIVQVRKVACAGLIFLLAGLYMPVSADDAIKYPVFSTELINGRSIWLTNCETCHAYGTAGAPNPLIPSQWEQRLKKPLPLLYQHAIDGFYGETDTYMPARGGNPNLSDEQVQSAVNYMLALAKFNSNTKVR